VYLLSLVIAPNPVSGGETTYINRDWTTEEMQGLRLEVVDATGKVVMRHQPTTYPIAVDGLPTAGIYLVRVIDGTGVVHFGRIVVVR
jgi:L-2-hydroxyglutarate oxidase LhgO